MIFLVRVAAVDGHAQRLGDLHSDRGADREPRVGDGFAADFNAMPRIDSATR